MNCTFNTQTAADDDDIEIIDIFVQCFNLRGFSASLCPMAILKSGTQGSFRLEGQTEFIPNERNPRFTKSTRVHFVFETKQPFEVEVVNVDPSTGKIVEQIGVGAFELADVLGSAKNVKLIVLHKKGNETGTVSICVDKLPNERLSNITFSIFADKIPKSSFFSSRNSFLTVSKMRLTRDQIDMGRMQETNFLKIPDKEWVRVYRSETYSSESISFPQFMLNSSKLFNNEPTLPLKFDLKKSKSNGEHTTIGTAIATMNDLIGSKTLSLFAPNGSPCGATLMIKHFSEEIFQFKDYLLGGLNINLIVGIDFTASNKDPNDPTSLHYMAPGSPFNQYQRVILSLGEVLQKYNHTEQIPAYGFGAKLAQGQPVSHFFPISFNPMQPFYPDFQKLFAGYAQCCSNVLFSGPTHFAPIISQVIDFTKKRFELNPLNYSVFLLITDGLINDLQKTIDEIIKGCYVPLSIVVIGVGDEDFKNMEVIDADVNPLVSSWGEVMKRDIVQFVPFKQFATNLQLLKKEVLQELPDQCVSFYRSIRLPPPAPIHQSLNTFELLKDLQMNGDVLPEIQALLIKAANEQPVNNPALDPRNSD